MLLSIPFITVLSATAAILIMHKYLIYNLPFYKLYIILNINAILDIFVYQLYGILGGWIRGQCHVKEWMLLIR